MTPENGKNDTKFAEKIKITDFLLGWISYLETFCRYCYVTWVYQLLYMYVKRSSRRTPLKVYRWRYRAILPHPLLKPISDVNFRHFWACAKFRDFSSMFRPSKMRLSLENNNNNNKYSCKQRWRAQASVQTPPRGNKKTCPAGTCITVTLWQSGFKGYGN